MDAIGLRNRVEFAKHLHPHKNVVQIIAGHIHRTIQGSCAGIPVSILKSPCHQAPMMLDEADLHAAVDEAGAYGLLLLGEDVIVHTQDVFE